MGIGVRGQETEDRAQRRTEYLVLSTEYTVESIRRTFGSSVRRSFVTSLLCFFGSISAAEPASYSDRLSSLATKCDEQSLKEQASATRGWIIPRHSGRQYLFLPATTDPAIPKSGAPPVARQWYDAFRALRREQAAALFAAAKAACDGQQPARAYQLLYEVLREDPDHAEARRILGFSKNARGQWALPETEKMVAEQQRINHPKLNWKARGYWRLATPHFEIVTNHSPAEALEAGQQLENLHTLWRQIFFRYWSTQEALAARFAGRDEPLARPRPKMQVVLFKNRQEYAAQLTPSQPQIAATVGIYQHKDRIAYFFAGDTSVYPTWYHEATHQLFQETRTAYRRIPRLGNETSREYVFQPLAKRPVQSLPSTRYAVQSSHQRADRRPLSKPGHRWLKEMPPASCPYPSPFLS
jgi:hypothetical protein